MLQRRNYRARRTFVPSACRRAAPRYARGVRRALASINEHRLQLEQFNSKAVEERQELLTELARAHESERSLAQRLERLETNFNEISAREQTAVDHLAAARADAAAGTEAIQARASRPPPTARRHPPPATRCQP